MRSSRTLAWTLLAGAGIAVAALGVLVLISLSRSLGTPFTAFEWLFGITYLSFLLVGALIVAHRMSSLVGLALGLAGLLGIANLPLAAYAHYALTTGEIGLAPLAVMLRSAAQGFSLLLVLAAVGMFPTGSYPSPRWRPASIAFLGAGAVFAVGNLVQPTVFFSMEFPDVPNPLSVQALADVFATLDAFVLPLMLPIVGVPVAAVVARFRIARGIERQQLKWLAYSSGLLAGTFVILILTRAWAFAVLLPFLLAMVPVSIGIAILRYRLYDIDVLIRRTLVYGALSVALVATYVVLVVVVQAALRPLTGGSELAVAGSTLATLAIVQPLRRRIRGFVDRRFYRSRYDAARTLDAFTTRMRNEVDIEAVRGDVLDVVRETLQPAHASVWLREAPTGSGGN